MYRVRNIAVRKVETYLQRDLVTARGKGNHTNKNADKLECCYPKNKGVSSFKEGVRKSFLQS